MYRKVNLSIRTSAICLPLYTARHRHCCLHFTPHYCEHDDDDVTHIDHERAKKAEKKLSDIDGSWVMMMHSSMKRIQLRLTSEESSSSNSHLLSKPQRNVIKANKPYGTVCGKKYTQFSMKEMNPIIVKVNCILWFFPRLVAFLVSLCRFWTDDLCITSFSLFFRSLLLV